MHKVATETQLWHPQGAIVANYPWDGSTDPNSTYSASPDDAAFRYLASVYANAHTNMHKSAEFPGGITNGAHWYPLSGGMQVYTHQVLACGKTVQPLQGNACWHPYACVCVCVSPIALQLK